MSADGRAKKDCHCKPETCHNEVMRARQRKKASVTPYKQRNAPPSLCIMPRISYISTILGDGQESDVAQAQYGMLAAASANILVGPCHALSRHGSLEVLRGMLRVEQRGGIVFDLVVRYGSRWYIAMQSTPVAAFMPCRSVVRMMVKEEVKLREVKWAPLVM